MLIRAIEGMATVPMTPVERERLRMVLVVWTNELALIKEKVE